MNNKIKASQIRRANYELFIFMLTVLSLFNSAVFFIASDEDIVHVALIMNFLLSAIFLIDFLFRLKIASSKRNYFIQEFGWLDLMGSIPIPGFILARLKHTIRVIRRMRRLGSRAILRQIVANRADTALLTIILAVVYILEFGSILMLRAEAHLPDSDISTAGDALWFVLVTISTVGYGDIVPNSQQGRVVAIFIIMAGVGVFGTLAAFLAKIFLGDADKAAADQSTAYTNQILAEIENLNELIESSSEEQKAVNAQILGRLNALEKRMEEKL